MQAAHARKHQGYLIAAHHLALIQQEARGFSRENVHATAIFQVDSLEMGELCFYTLLSISQAALPSQNDISLSRNSCQDM